MKLVDKHFLDQNQVYTMLAAQLKLNILYNGDVWLKDRTFFGKFQAAADAELSEMMDEITEHWKWYEKRNPQNNKEKALFEAVDVVHFMLAGILHTSNVSDISGLYSILNEELSVCWENSVFNRTMDMSPKHKDFYTPVSTHYKGFWMMLYMSNSSKFVGIKNGHLGHSVKYFQSFVADVCKFLGYSIDDFYKAYNLKNARNAERVAGGVMKGVDVKSKEKELHLG